MRVISPPSKEINDLMSFLTANDIPVSRVDYSKKKYINNNSEIIIIVNGAIDIYQRKPSYYMGTLVGPIVIGLIEQLYTNFDINYKVTSSDLIYALKVSDIKPYMNCNELMDIALRVSCYFNDLLITQFQEVLLLNAEEKVKLFIRRYIRLKAKGAPLCGLCDYIMHRGYLSRSMVMKVISELKREGKLVIEKDGGVHFKE